MNNTRLYILGSSIFFNTIKELEIFDSIHYFNDLPEIPTDLKNKKDNIVRVIFPDKSKNILSF